MKAKDEKKPKRKLAFSEMWEPYKQLLPYVKPYRVRFIWGIIFGGVANALNAALMLILKVVGDHAFPGGTGGGGMSMFSAAKAHGEHSGPGLGGMILVCSLIPLVMILRSLMNYFKAYWMAWVGTRLVVDLRTALFRHLLHQSLGFFNNQRSGNLMSRVSNDTRMAQTTLTSVTTDIFTQPIGIISAAGMLLFFDWKFAVFSLVLFPVCLIPLIIFGRKIRHLAKQEDAQAGAFMVIMHEAFGGIKVVKSMAREEYEANHFKESGLEQFRTSMRVRKSIEVVSPMIESVGAIGAGLAFFYVAYFHLSTGTFMMLIAGLFLLYDPAKKLSRIYMQLQKCLASTTRVFDLMKIQPEIGDSPTAISLPPSYGAISFDNVGFSYIKGTPAVSGINLSVEPGKTYALVGASGAGKSTMIALILRFYDPESGAIRIDGHDLRSVTQASLRDQISIVTQDTFLFHDTIYENIRYGRFDATQAEIHEAARLAYAHDFIMEKEKGYQTVIGDKGNMLSGGQQQRLAIARALLRNAPILLLDEATSALDSESEQQIQSALETLAKGRTVIAIAHRLSTILNSDQIVVMDHGRIVEQGTHSELYDKSGHYRRLYDLQFHRNEHPENEEDFEVVSLR